MEEAEPPDDRCGTMYKKAMLAMGVSKRDGIMHAPAASADLEQCGWCSPEGVAPEHEPEPELRTGPTDPAVFEYLRTLKDELPPTNQRKLSLSKVDCSRCDHATFSCRGHLFAHIKKAGHAVLTVRPRDAMAFDNAVLEHATLEFLRWLANVPSAPDAAWDVASTPPVETELPHHLVFNPSSYLVTPPTLSMDSLTAFLDSGESMLTVIVARLLTTPPAGPSRVYLTALVEQLADEPAVWQRAEDFESFTVPGKATHVGMTAGQTVGAGGHSQPVSRPREMWGLKRVIPDLSPIELARTDYATCSEITELLSSLLPAGFDAKEECVVCADKAFMCAGAGGALARNEGCGCVTCVESMGSWITTQVDSEMKGTGEVICVGCPRPLTQVELDRCCPEVAGRAEQIALEKALVTMADWMWCPVGCGAGGFANGMGMAKGCKTAHCPACDGAACVDCGVMEKHHALHNGAWCSCVEALRERDDAEATEARLSNAKRCPKEHGGCSGLTERDGGCSHMTCRVCTFQWCWLCEGKYKGKYTNGTKCPC